LKKYPSGVREMVRHVTREEMCGNADEVGNAGRGKPRYHIDSNVFFLLRCKGCADEAGPKNEVSEKRIRPKKSHGKEIAEDNLRERENDHGAQQENDHRPFNEQHSVSERLEYFHLVSFG
jgi:hypothetical protein